MRKADIFIAVEGTLLLLCGALLAVHPLLRQRDNARLDRETALVARFGLTDLCLFTEARYTRHLSQADLHAAFQDQPRGLDHFPSGSLVAPPLQLTGGDALLAQPSPEPSHLAGAAVDDAAAAAALAGDTEAAPALPFASHALERPPSRYQ
jgi:hypothetical protein